MKGRPTEVASRQIIPAFAGTRQPTPRRTWRRTWSVCVRVCVCMRAGRADPAVSPAVESARRPRRDPCATPDRLREPLAMSFTRLLIANRAEIAIRIARSARELGLHTIAVASEDDRDSLHLRHADEAHVLRGVGPAPYLDIEQLLSIAAETGAQALHPGYGFLSESARLSRRCATRRARSAWRASCRSRCCRAAAARSTSRARRRSWPSTARSC
jgi:hypothetical protein